MLLEGCMLYTVHFTCVFMSFVSIMKSREYLAKNIFANILYTTTQCTYTHSSIHTHTHTHIHTHTITCHMHARAHNAHSALSSDQHTCTVLHGKKLLGSKAYSNYYAYEVYVFICVCVTYIILCVCTLFFQHLM